MCVGKFKLCLERVLFNEEDKLIWAASPNGDFNLNSAYSIENGEGHQQSGIK